MSHLTFKHALRATTALIGLATVALAASPAFAIVGNDNYPPPSLVDPTDVTGIGQLTVDLEDGYIGLCTATLINPRTVIFASHCVNETPDESAPQPASAYGVANGGLPISFGFKSNNRPALEDWFQSGYQTNVSDRLYNSNYVIYDPNSLALGVGNNFLQSDVAMAALDTPVVGVPTWTLLFSPLTAPAHATVEGYGTNGTGTTGDSGGIDFRRRVAENTISLLGSLDDQDSVLFGAPDGLPQNLYMADFNDPKFGTAEANQYDFDVFHDAALQKEAITAPGDSGGPLIVDKLFSIPVVAAVLSGGDSFFNGQPGSSYGTTSFYQPLYLFWDWIIANNPYKYVSAKAGDGSWFDPNHWVTDLDPNYVTIVNGKLVNALPTTPAQGTPADGEVNTPKFGNVCYYDDCVNIATGVETVYSSTAALPKDALIDEKMSGGPEVVALSSVAKGLVSGGTGNDANSSVALMKAALIAKGFHVHATQAQSAAPEGSATVGGEVVQGAPGSSDFVPNDTDGDPSIGAPPRYYDVTLSADGTTTLDDGFAIVDRLTVDGAKAGLNIGASGALASLIDTTVYAGNFNVDGVFISVGDIALLGGVLSGNGQIVAPYTTAVLGAIAPGTVGTVGDLSVFGDVVLSSGSGTLIDLASGGSDRLDVFGDLALGGTAVFTPVTGFTPHYHYSSVFATGDTITGSYTNVPDTIAGVLYPSVSIQTVGTGDDAYQEAVVTLDAATFASQLTNATPDQLQVGNALDSARASHYGDLENLYDAIDPLSGSALSSALNSLVPNDARSLPMISQMITEAFTGFVWQHLGEISSQSGAEATAFNVQTNALQLVQNSTVGSVQTRSLLSGLGQLATGSQPVVLAPSASPAEATDNTFGISKGFGGFLSGSSLDGSVSVGPGGKADVNGYLITGGVDLPISDHFKAGIAISYADATGKLKSSPEDSETHAFHGAGYGRYDGDGWYISGYAGSSGNTIDTTRLVTVGATQFRLSGHTTGHSPEAGLQFGEYYQLDGVQIVPAVGFESQSYQINGYTETGGAAAMAFNSYSIDTFDLRAGFDAYGSFKVGTDTTVKPMVHAFFVDDIEGRSGPLEASFAAAPGSLMSFGLPSSTGAWAELGVGLETNIDDNVTIGAHYNADTGGKTTYGAWTGSLQVTF